MSFPVWVISNKNISERKSDLNLNENEEHDDDGHSIDSDNYEVILNDEFTNCLRPNP